MYRIGTITFHVEIVSNEIIVILVQGDRVAGHMEPAGPCRIRPLTKTTPIYQFLRPSIPCMKTALTILFIIAFALACGCTTKAPSATQTAGVPAPSPAAAPPVPQATAGGTTLPAPSAPAYGMPAGTETAAVQPGVTVRDPHDTLCARIRYDPSIAGCCTDTLFLINQSVCCGGKLYDNATTGCCGSRPYNYSTEGCCGSTVYDLRKEYCCNNRVVTSNCNEGNGSISR